MRLIRPLPLIMRALTERSGTPSMVAISCADIDFIKCIVKMMRSSSGSEASACATLWDSLIMDEITRLMRQVWQGLVQTCSERFVRRNISLGGRARRALAVQSQSLTNGKEFHLR